MRLWLLLFAALGLGACEAGGQSTTKTNDVASQFAALQARAGVATFDATCLASLPDFATAPKLLAQEGLTRSNRVWTAGGGAISISIHENESTNGCIATIARTNTARVLPELRARLSRRFETVKLGSLNGSPSFKVRSKGQDAFVTIAPATAAGVTVLANASKS